MAQSIPFDTLAYTKKLVAAGFTQQQAEVQAETLAEFVNEQLVSKQYLDLKLSQNKEDIIKWVAGMLVAQAAIVATLVKLL
ncbi:MAG: CCDC90 family protein [Cytophagales bacterium]|nr:CCDC90 family protein [Cytophagales bacterium]